MNDKPQSPSALNLSQTQNIIWLGQQMHQDLPVYNAAYSFKFETPLDVQAFSKAHEKLIQTTDSFRIVFKSDASIVKQYLLESAPETLQFHKCPQLIGNDFREVLIAETKQTLDLSTCPWRSILFEEQDGTHTWLLIHHHLLTDGIGFQIILNRLSKLYEYEINTDSFIQETTEAFFFSWVSSKKPPIIQPQEKHQEYESSKLYSSKITSGSPLGERHSQRLKPNLKSDIEALIETEDFTSFSKELSINLILLSSLFALLSRIERKNTICIGIANHGRTSKIEKEIAGVLVTVNPLTIELEETETFTSLYQKVRDAYFDQMRRSLNISTDVTDTQEFDVTFSFLSGEISNFAGIPVDAEWLYPGCHESANRWRIHFMNTEMNELNLINDFNNESFSSPGKINAASNLISTITAFTSNPRAKINTFPLIERSNQNNSTLKTELIPLPQICNLANRFDLTATKNAKTIAVKSEYEQCTYQELVKSTQTLSYSFSNKEHNNDLLVPIIGKRSIKMLQCSLAAIKAGKAFLPVDSDLPEQRVKTIIEDSKASVIIDTNRPFSKETAIPPEQISESEIAYVIYTSGSTGTPNGVTIKHDSVINLLEDMERRAPLVPNSRCMWWTAVSFDVSIYEIFSAILYGHTLCIPPESIRTNPIDLFDWMLQNEINSAYLPPFMLAPFDKWLDENKQLQLKRLLVGVEPIQEDLLVSICNKLEGLNIVNGYGPTEATVCATFYTIDNKSEHLRRTPIGTPVSGNQCYILDKNLNVMPQGTTGELYIGGIGLAKAYWNRPELDAVKFLNNPFSNDNNDQRIYKTGDLVRLSDEGQLEFISRDDSQIKLRGQRIEPAEIEKTMAIFPAIDQCIVQVAQINQQDELICYYVSAEKIPNENLFSHAGQYLPFQLLPKRFYYLNEFPTTNNGKIDFTKLKDLIDENTESLQNTDTKSDNPVEIQIAEIWKEELELTSVGTNENFFELGGSSMAAMKIAQMLCHEFEIDLPLQVIFQSPTISLLASVVEEEVLKSIENMSDEEASKFLQDDDS